VLGVTLITKSDQIVDTNYQNQGHFIRHILKTVSERSNMAGFGSSRSYVTAYSSVRRWSL